MVLLTLALLGQVVGMKRGWAWSRHVGNYTTRHWAYMGLASAVLAWLYFHWVVAMIWAPGLTATVAIVDIVVFLVFFALGVGAWFLRQLQGMKG